MTPHYFTRLFSPENIPNIALVIVGIAGIITALCTLRILSRQTTAIESQVNTQRETIRARLTIGFQDNVFDEILQNGRAVVSAKFINTGGTPAYKVVPETWLEFVSPKFEDFSYRAIHHVGNPVAVYPTTPTLFDIPLGRRASYDEIAGLRHAQLTLAVRIRLTYESMGKSYFVDRAFFAIPNGMEMHPKYNDAD
jgi:Co/Zn/Cd efflux system component